MALEGRSYVLSVSGIIKPDDIGVELPDVEKLHAIERPFLANGGTCIASPNGEWLVDPITDKECLIIADLDHSNIRKSQTLTRCGWTLLQTRCFRTQCKSKTSFHGQHQRRIGFKGIVALFAIHHPQHAQIPIYRADGMACLAKIQYALVQCDNPSSVADAVFYLSRI